MDKSGRRKFLISSISLMATGTLYPLHKALANTNEHAGHAGHNQPPKEMNHGHAAHTAQSIISPSATLLPISALPKGLPLPQLPKLPNESKQQGKFVATLTASETQVPLISGMAATTMWLYNKTLLPVIDVSVNDSVKIKFNNHLQQDGTIHWHGLAVPAEQDGNPQDPVAPGKSFDYQFQITPQMAGTHWFHPHTHNYVAQQVYMGLAGLFIVRDPADPIAHIPEQNLFFLDLKLDDQAQIPPNDMMDVMNGREGQFALINGALEPQITLTGTQRWRLWNGNSARYLDLLFPENKVTAYLVGTDGGLLEAPQKITSILLTPGERAEIVLTPVAEQSFNLIARAYNRDKMGNPPPEQDRIMAQVMMKPGKKIDLPTKLRSIPELGQPKVKRQVVYTEDSQMNFYINGKIYDMNRIDFFCKVGETEEWEVFNNSHMDHNFHLHGTHFLVKEFERNGKISKPSYKMLKDTINLKPYEKVRILMKQNHKGIRMFHCHILEHENAGMMGQLLAQ